VPEVVTGEPPTLNIEGAVNPTLVTVPEPPPPLYCGMFRVLPIKVAAPLVPVVVSDIVFCLPLKVFQSVEVKIPLTDVLALDKAFCLLLNVVQSADNK